MEKQSALGLGKECKTVQNLRDLGLDSGNYGNSENSRSGRKGMETEEILTLLGLEERLEFLGKIRSLILAKNRLVKSWGVRSVVSHSRVRDPLGFYREN